MSVTTTPEKAHKSVKGSAPRFRSAKEELPELSRIYIQERNAKLALQRRGAEIDLALREGTLIPRRRAKVQLGFLLTGLRQRLMSLSYALAPRLVDKSEHEISQTIDIEIRAALRDIATWPAKMADPNWQEAVASDLMPVEAGGDELSAKALIELETAEKKAAAVQKVVIRQREKRRRKV